MQMRSKFTKIQIFFLIGLFVAILGFVGYKYFQAQKTAKNSQRTVVDKPIAYFFDKTDIESFVPTDKKGQALPRELIIKPGVYEVYGKNYDLEREGLYRFLEPTESNQQRIVYQDNLDALLSSIAWISIHGLEDNNKSQKELLEKAQKDKLSINCGVVSLFAQRILDENKIENRLVKSLTLEEWNSYDTGHTLNEVFRNGQWQVYDLDNNVIFRRNNRYLNFVDLTKAVSEGDYQIEKIANDAAYDISGSIKNNYDYNFYFEAIFADEQTLRDWYKKVFQVPLVKDDSTYYFFDEENKERVKSYSTNYKFMPKEEFMKKFYKD